jgi:hypothetical protein
VKRLYFVALVALVMASPAAAQLLTPKPKPPLTPEKLKIQSALVMLRDSLSAVQGGAGRLERDLATSSDAVTRTRSHEISEACASSSRASNAVQQTVTDSPDPVSDPKKTRTAVVAALRDLRSALDQCHEEFTRLGNPQQAEELRGYGLSRAARLNAPISRYNLAVANYLGPLDMELPVGTVSPPNH